MHANSVGFATRSAGMAMINLTLISSSLSKSQVIFIQNWFGMRHLKLLWLFRHWYIFSVSTYFFIFLAVFYLWGRSGRVNKEKTMHKMLGIINICIEKMFTWIFRFFLNNLIIMEDEFHLQFSKYTEHLISVN